MPEKKAAAEAAAATEKNEKPVRAAKAPKTPKAPKAAKPAAEKKTAAKKTDDKTAAARRGRPPLTPEVYVEQGGKQYNVSDIVERVKADYRAEHKVGVQSCKIYIKAEEGAAYYIVNKEQGKLEL